MHNWVGEVQNIPLLAGSPDGVAAISNQDGDVVVSAVEIKIMTAIRTIESVTRLKANLRSICECPSDMTV